MAFNYLHSHCACACRISFVDPFALDLGSFAVSWGICEDSVSAEEQCIASSDTLQGATSVDKLRLVLIRTYYRQYLSKYFE